MKKPKKSEKLLLKEISASANQLLKHQRGLEIGRLIALIRGQLGMSQRTLAKRAKVPQPTISRIESCCLQAKVSTLRAILDAMGCNLLLTPVFRQDPEEICMNQAKAKALKKFEYIQGTMSLEKQRLDQPFIDELMKEEIENLLHSKKRSLWEENL